ncbi:MAG: RNB domain-containing ribonuclease [Acidobacteriota bacterium]|nr:RNB domain-containing ribonuclease [Acidobacteriota bacterium]
MAAARLFLRPAGRGAVSFNLLAAARREMAERGFEPDLPEAAVEQARTLEAHDDPGLRDLTGLLWSSVDNDDSRDLDQIEWAERAADGIRVLIGVADVDALAALGTPIDAHAERETTTVYTGVHTFPMLPERLSTDLTSLNEGPDRAAIVIEMLVAPDGGIAQSSVYRAVVRNRAQLTYSAVGGWLEGGAAPPKIAASAELAAQLKLQDEAARMLREARGRNGALSFDRQEVQTVVENGRVKGIAAWRSNRASHLIEDFMIGANEVMARTLRDGGVTSIRRVVKAPERWERIVELAGRYGESLPHTPDAGALNRFLLNRKNSDPTHYADVSLAVLKLLGPGEYVAARPGGEQDGHFGLAAHDYTHSTAPNRRFADLVTQRLLKAFVGKSGAPYPDERLDAIARACTVMEDAARKVQRDMAKRIAAVAVEPRIGEEFAAVVTGVTRKGVFVRVAEPPVEGRLMRGEGGLDVGDRIRVRLQSTDPERGFIDFVR